MGYKRLGPPDKGGDALFQIECRINGRRYRKRVSCPPGAIKAIYETWYLRLIEPERDMRLYEALDTYVERKRLTGMLPKELEHVTLTVKLLHRHFKDNPRLVDLSRGRIEEFLAWRRSHPLHKHLKRCSASTVNHALRLISGTFSHEIKMGRFKLTNPCAGLKLSEVEAIRSIWLSSDQVQELVEAAKKRGKLQTAILLAIGAGLRRRELLQLQWVDVSIERSLLVVRAVTSKTGRGRAVPLPDFLLRHLIEMRKKEPEATDVFGDYKNEYRLRSQWRRFRATIPWAEQMGLRLHDLRGQFAQDARAAGISMNDIALMMGHANPALTAKRYAQSGAINLCEKIKRLDELHAKWAMDGQSAEDQTKFIN